MTSGAILSRTPSLGLAKLRFNFPNWGDEHNRNMELIDAALLSIGVAFDGAWDNDTTFPIGAKVIDPDNATFWRALVAHTSPSSGTFSEARAAEPTYWEEIINMINFRGEWADVTAYQLNDIVFSGYKWAIVVATHTSATSFDTGVADNNLEIFFDGTTTVTDAEAAATAAGTSETNASTFATNASNSASAAAQSAIDAAGEAAAALIHRNKAEQWAEEAEDVAVETGQFSAKHHRIKAAVHESEAKDARDEAVNRLENAAGAVRHDVVQTLMGAAQAQARENIALEYSDIPFLAIGITGYYAVDTSKPGAQIPPTNDPRFRFVLCTAGEDGVGGYNEGILINESVVGSAPLVVATAEIDLAASPLDGETINLINTERRFLRAGAAGTVENDQIQNITGTVGDLLREGSTNTGTGALSRDSGSLASLQAGNSRNITTVSFDASNSARAGNETRPKNIGVTYFMRIL